MSDKTPEQKVAEANSNLAVIGIGVVVTTIATIVMAIREGYHPVVAIVFSVMIVPPIVTAILGFTNLSSDDKKVLEVQEQLEKEELENYLRNK